MESKRIRLLGCEHLSELHLPMLLEEEQQKASELMWHRLRENGYLIVRNVITEEQCAELYEGFWDYMEGMNPALKRGEPETWQAKELPLTTKGLIQHYNVGLQPFTVRARVLAKPVFELLYRTGDLTSSWDGVSFTRKASRQKYASLEDFEEHCWDRTPLHIDQTTLGEISIQGGLAVTEQRADEHVFVCIPGSHKHHAKLLELGPAKKSLHWEIQEGPQIQYLREQGLVMKRIPLGKGDFVLWESRLCHASAPHCKTARADAVRLQVFVCMRPALTGEEAAREKAKRELGYAKGLVSKHSADHMRFFGKTPRIFSAEMKQKYDSFRIPPSVEMNEAEKKLHGLALYS